MACYQVANTRPPEPRTPGTRSLLQRVAMWMHNGWTTGEYIQVAAPRATVRRVTFVVVMQTAKVWD